MNASGNNGTSGNTNGGNGGLVLVATSTMGSVIANGGQGFGSGSAGTGGTVTVNSSTLGNITSGSIILSGTNLNISNKTYNASSTLNISYSGSLTTTNTTLSALQHFIISSTDYGSYVGGSFPLFPSTINTCGNLYFSGTYTLGGPVTGSCNISNSGITIAGGSNTLTGNVTANNYGVTLSAITVTGAVSTTGASPGALTVNNVSNLTGSISVTGAILGDGSSSLGSTTISTGGSVGTSSVSFVNDVINNGTINPGVTVSGKTTNNSIINTGAGSFAFNATSTNSGTVNGNAVLSASSTNTGTITGNATLNAYTSAGGSVSFSGTTAFAGIGYVNGNVYDSTGTTTITTWVFNASSTNTGIIKGTAIFNDGSSNIISGTVTGNATFNNNSRNLGTVTGNSSVNSPVTRPLGGTTSGQVIYYGYSGTYFNDSASGHGVAGKWDDLNNWWTDINATIHAPVLPTAGDNVIILSGNITSSGVTAYVNSATFQATSTNSISLIVGSSATDAAMFNASSTNSNLGTIVGNATFSGPDTTNNGTVTGFITRQYNAGVFTVVTDFTHNGIHWIIQAINGATVDLTGAIYSLAINTFQALNNAVFVWNNSIGAGAPSLSITYPTVGTNIKWKPTISWGVSTVCQYKIDGGSYTSIDCSKNGSDVPRPTAGAHTIFFKTTNSNNATEKSVLFTYDNTQPVDTDCSLPLDEATRPYYYLTANVGNCSVTASTTIRGDDNGGGHFYTMGSLTGSSTNVALQNVSATGTVSRFNNITVASSTLSGDITVVGTLSSDSLSTFGSTTVQTLGTVSGGRFVNNLVNNGTITNGTIVLGSTINRGTINGVFTFNATSTNSGTVNGTTTLNDASINQSTINGNTTLNGTALNQGTVNGDLTFGTLTSVYGVVTFSSSTNFLGTGHVSGNTKDNRGSIITVWSFKGLSSNTGFTQGNGFFGESSTNIGIISGDAYFTGSSTNYGTTTGNADAYNTATVPLSGVVSGSVTYHSYPNSVSFKNISGDNSWGNLSNWFEFATSSIPLERTPVNGEDIVLFASTTLVSNLTNNIYIATASTTLDGANHTVTGNVSGNGAYGGHDAYDFNLQNIIVTGTTTANGGDGTPSVNGGKGGSINISTSSTGVISANGGDPLHNGGDAGTITVINSYAVQDSTPILAVGGNSSGCGFGGSGGNVSLIDSSGYVLITNPGVDATTTIAQGGGCINPPVGTSGHSGSTIIVGTYHAPSSNNSNNNTNNGVHNAGGSTFNADFMNGLNPFFKTIAKLSPLVLKPIQSLIPGEGGLFLLSTGITKFLTATIPEEIVNKFASSPDLLHSLGIEKLSDYLALKYRPIVVKNTGVKGLFSIYRRFASNSANSQVSVQSRMTLDSKNSLVQSIKVAGGDVLTLTLNPTSSGKTNNDIIFNGVKTHFVNGKATIVVPTISGIYILKSPGSPVSLQIEVLKKVTPAVGSKDLILNLFDNVSNFFQKIFSWHR